MADIQTDRVDIAALASVTTSLGFIQSQMSEMRADIKNLSNTFSTKEELAQTARDTEQRIVRLEKESNLWRWLSPSLAALLSAGITFLFINFLQNLQTIRLH